VTAFNQGDLSKSPARPEFFCYKSFDGTEIEAALYRPRTLAQGIRAPLVVSIHGGPTGHRSDEFGYASATTQRRVLGWLDTYLK